MSDKLDEVTRLFNVMFPSYVMTYEHGCDHFRDIIDVSINRYYHIRLTGECVLTMSVKETLAEIMHLFVNLKISEVKEN